MSARVVVALGGSAGESLAVELVREGIEVVAVREPAALVAAAADTAYGLDAMAAWEALDAADVLVLPAERGALAAELVSACDRRGVRIVPVGTGSDSMRLALSFGLTVPIAPGDPWAVADAVRSPSAVPVAIPDPPSTRGRVIAVWGPHGAPGRSTVATLLAIEMARGDRHAALVDADVHAPSIALSLGLADEGPGFAAACRQAGLGALDVRELTRISVPLGMPDGSVDVLCGLNRPGRWPELAESRVEAALDLCRDWAEFTVVDVAASLDTDEELMSDLEDGPRRNGATLAALRSADVIVAVCGADPLSVARFLRGYAELREIVGPVPVLVLVNRLRPGGLGIDARGQVRRALERFVQIDDVAFLPLDQRAADSAQLRARSIAESAPRSPLVSAIRRFVGESLLPVLGPALGGGPVGDVMSTSPGTGTARRRRGRRAERRTA